MYKVLSKDNIENQILPFLPIAVKGPKISVPICELVDAILYKLKTGVQWDMLPVCSLFSSKPLHYKTVFGHYRNWCKSGAWKDCWIGLVGQNKKMLDLSSMDLDGSHTTALRGGEKVGYQGRKKRKTTNMLVMADRQGIPVALSEPTSGRHNDLFDIGRQVGKMVSDLSDAGISTDGLFLNADAGFDSEEMRLELGKWEIIPNIAHNSRNGSKFSNYMFDEDLYSLRYSVERTNAWMDSYRSVLNRFDTTKSSWMGFNYLATIVIFIKK